MHSYKTKRNMAKLTTCINKPFKDFPKYSCQEHSTVETDLGKIILVHDSTTDKEIMVKLNNKKGSRVYRYSEAIERGITVYDKESDEFIPVIDVIFK